MSRFSLAARALVLGAALLGTGFLVGLGFQSRATAAGARRRDGWRDGWRDWRRAAGSNRRRRPLRRRSSKVCARRPTGACWPLPASIITMGAAACGSSICRRGARARRLRPPVGKITSPPGATTGAPCCWNARKIPRPAARAKAGIYDAPVDGASLSMSEPRNVTPDLPRGEKIVSGLYAPDGTLILKTRSDPKTLFKSRRKRRTGARRAL